MIKVNMTLTFTKLLGLFAIITAAVLAVWLNSEGIAMTIIPSVFGAIANQDYQNRKKTQYYNELNQKNHTNHAKNK